MRSICVYCGANPGSKPEFRDAAEALGTAIGRAGHRLVYGGGRVGLMGIVADAVLATGGEALGVMPRHLVDREIAHQGLTELIVTESMHDRKAAMVAAADGFVALPGGFGTLDEVFEALTWNQIGTLAKPVALFDVVGYYAPLLGFLDHAVEAGLLMPAHRAMAQLAASAEAALEIAVGAAPPTISKWTELAR